MLKAAIEQRHRRYFEKRTMTSECLSEIEIFSTKHKAYLRKCPFFLKQHLALSPRSSPKYFLY